MSSTLKTIFQYVIIFGITALLIWFSLRNLNVGEGEDKWDYLVKTWQSADKFWLILMAALTMLSHVIRAERWRMLIRPSGHQPLLWHSLISLMVGYLVNLVIPRGGEVSRCYNLYKLDAVPVETSFGTVVVERIVDLLCLASLLVLAFVLESDKLLQFIETLPIGGGGRRLSVLFYLIAIGAVLLVIFLWIIRSNQKIRAFVMKTWLGFKEGLLSVFKLDNKLLFFVYSISIWLLYFVMSYCVIQAFPETNHLGVEAVLSLFAIGSIAMAAPLPGGTGAYHVLVPQGLVLLYGLPKANAVAFTFIFHGWQTAIVIVFGALSIILTGVLLKRKTKNVA